MYELQWITRKPDAEKQLFVARARCRQQARVASGGVMMTEESEPPDERKPNQK
jgi:hypothetical protein